MLYVVLFIIGGFALHGYLRGFIRLAFSFLSVFLAVSLASAASPSVAGALRDGTPLYGAIREKCAETLRGKTEEALGGIAGAVGLPAEGALLDGAAGIMEESGVYEDLANQIAEAAVSRIAWVVSFLAAGALLFVLARVLDLASRLPVIGGVNRLGGLAVGILQGLLIVWILFFVMELCAVSEAGGRMLGDIRANPFLEFLYVNNPIEKVVMGILSA